MQKRSRSFYLIHFSVLGLLIGALITYRFGINGTLKLQNKMTSSFITLDTNRDLASSFGNNSVVVIDKSSGVGIIVKKSSKSIQVKVDNKSIDIDYLNKFTKSGDTAIAMEIFQVKYKE